MAKPKVTIRKNSRPNPLPMDEVPQFEIPESFLTQLAEFSEGGYILIACPGGTGAPEVYSSFDTVRDMYAYHSFAKDYFVNVNKNLEKMTDDFLGISS